MKLKMVKEESRTKYIIAIAVVIILISLIYFFFPKNVNNQETTTTITTSVPYKKIIIESVTAQGVVTLRLMDQANIIEVGEVKVFNGDDEEINIGLCPQQPIIPDGRGTCLIDLSKCQSGRGITITGPGDGDEASCP